MSTKRRKEIKTTNGIIKAITGVRIEGRKEADIENKMNFTFNIRIIQRKEYGGERI